MKRYDDYKTDKSKFGLTKEELSQIKWTKYKIIVPTEDDKNEIIEAIEHIHHTDTVFITVNQLSHEYLELSHEYLELSNNIIVDKNKFDDLI